MGTVKPQERTRGEDSGRTKNLSVRKFPFGGVTPGWGRRFLNGVLRSIVPKTTRSAREGRYIEDFMFGGGNSFQKFGLYTPVTVVTVVTVVTFSPLGPFPKPFSTVTGSKGAPVTVVTVTSKQA